ncbi:serine hydroxymethyltransferase family protein, partial [Vibrio parahaemolyticus V-223/04]
WHYFNLATPFLACLWTQVAT